MHTYLAFEVPACGLEETGPVTKLMEWRFVPLPVLTHNLLVGVYILALSYPGFLSSTKLLNQSTLACSPSFVHFFLTCFARFLCTEFICLERPSMRVGVTAIKLLLEIQKRQENTNKVRQ